MKGTFSSQKLSGRFLGLCVFNRIVDADTTGNQQQNDENCIISQTKITGVDIFSVHFQVVSFRRYSIMKAVCLQAINFIRFSHRVTLE